MNRDAPLSDDRDVDDRIDERCDAFETAWRSGNRPNLANFIGPEDQPYRNRLFGELLLVELECRRSVGEHPTQQDYLREFPEFAAQIEAANLQYGSAAFSTDPASGNHAIHNDEFQPGSRIDHFELLERLGEGAMGQAWKAWDTRLRRNVTIKLPRHHSLAEHDVRRFLRESEAAAKLSHPQLTSIHEVRPAGNTFYIVAKYVEGENLHDYARGRQFTFQEIAKLCAAAGDALHHAHVASVVHRDLKPANIIVDSSGLPHIIDFGLAKISNTDHDLTMHGELLGTPAYMSPELASGHGDSADARTDIYSLGVVLYELLTSRCPFVGNRTAVISQILACEPAPIRKLQPAVPRDLETICHKAIEKCPEQRYGTACEIAEDLRRFADGLPIRARRSAIPEKSWRWIRRHPAASVSIALIVAVIAVASSTIASLQKQNQRLEGFRPVRITTTPSGARVALVPINPKTNEPSLDSDDVVRPSGVTPLTISMPSGKYLVEAVLTTEDSSQFVEVYRTVMVTNRVAPANERANVGLGLDPETCRFQDIVIESSRELIQRMAEVPIDENLRKSNPLLPRKLYVDVNQTTAADGRERDSALASRLTVTADGTHYIQYGSAVGWAESNQKRLASAAEYDAIVAAVSRGEARMVKDGAPVEMPDLFDDFPEFSTTIKTEGFDGNAARRDFREMRVLKGYKNLSGTPELISWADGTLLTASDSESSKVSIRGVRSATPRLVKP